MIVHNNLFWFLFGFRQEFQEAVKKGMKYDFTHFVLICKQQRLAPLPQAANATSSTTVTSSRTAWETVYVNAEEEFFSEVSLISDRNFLNRKNVTHKKSHESFVCALLNYFLIA